MEIGVFLGARGLFFSLHKEELRDDVIPTVALGRVVCLNVAAAAPDGPGYWVLRRL